MANINLVDIDVRARALQLVTSVNKTEDKGVIELVASMRAKHPFMDDAITDLYQQFQKAADDKKEQIKDALTVLYIQTGLQDAIDSKLTSTDIDYKHVRGKIEDWAESIALTPLDRALKETAAKTKWLEFISADDIKKTLDKTIPEKERTKNSLEDNIWILEQKKTSIGAKNTKAEYEYAIEVLNLEQQYLAGKAAVDAEKKLALEQKNQPQRDPAITTFTATKASINVAYEELLGLGGSKRIITGKRNINFSEDAANSHELDFDSAAFRNRMTGLYNQHVAKYNVPAERSALLAELHNTAVAEKDTEPFYGADKIVFLQMLGRAKMIEDKQLQATPETQIAALADFDALGESTNSYLENAGKLAAGESVSDSEVAAKPIQKKQANNEEQAGNSLVQLAMNTSFTGLVKQDNFVENPNEMSVKQLQAKLRDADPKYAQLLGAYGLDKDGVDGKYGGCTEAAVKAFQLDHKLEPTGKADQQFVAQLELAEFSNVAKNGTDKSQWDKEYKDVQKLEASLSVEAKKELDAVLLTLNGKVEQSDGPVFAAVQSVKASSLSV